jgi:hypothetical protein
MVLLQFGVNTCTFDIYVTRSGSGCVITESFRAVSFVFVRVVFWTICVFMLVNKS